MLQAEDNLMANYIVKAYNGSDGTDSRKKSTFSVWVKRSKIGTSGAIWSWGENNSSDAYLRFDDADNLEFHSDGTDSPIDTSRVFRDMSAWYHIVCVLDGQNGTEALRRRIWINGEEIIHGASCSTFDAAVAGHNSVQDLYIGDVARQQQGGTAARPFHGYMSHFHYCDGFAYTASDFGEFDSTSGIWKIKTGPDVSYGTHGIFLKMEDSSNMDLDSSPNASSQLSTTGTITLSQDCPSNNFPILDQSICTTNNFDISNGGTEGTYGSGWKQVFSTLPIKAGKWYWETKQIAGTYVKAGMCTAEGAGERTSWTNAHLANYDNGWAFYAQNGAAEVRTNGAVISGYANADLGSMTIGNGDILCIALDLDNHKMYMRKNDGSWIVSGDPTNSSTGLDISHADKSGYYVPGLALHSATAAINFGNGYFGTTAVSSAVADGAGNGKFEYAPPTGYYAICTKNIATYG